MDGIVCSSCHTWMPMETKTCSSCSTALVYDGDSKNIIDRIHANCLIHRYAGSDLLEPAVILKEGKSNFKVATHLKEYPKPITIAKDKVYAFNHSLLSSIQTLRNERTATMLRYDQLIQSHWQKLKLY